MRRPRSRELTSSHPHGNYYIPLLMIRGMTFAADYSQISQSIQLFCLILIINIKLYSFSFFFLFLSQLYSLSLVSCYNKIRALAFGDARKKKLSYIFKHHFHLFYQLILQLNLHLNFYFTHYSIK